jgi:hypothetical protein
MSDTTCSTCHTATGALDTETMDEGRRCQFGCGRPVDEDTGICPSCHEHSLNVWECPACSTEYGCWRGRWALVTTDCKCDGDRDCPDCHPECPDCRGRGYFGWSSSGFTCDTCKGMGTLGWTDDQIQDAAENRQIASDRRHMEG